MLMSSLQITPMAMLSRYYLLKISCNVLVDSTINIISMHSIKSCMWNTR